MWNITSGPIIGGRSGEMHSFIMHFVNLVCNIEGVTAIGIWS